jgi:hypothetical protein
MSHKIAVALLGLSALLALGACNRQHSAADVQKDTASAAQKAAENVGNAEDKADKRVASARGDVRDEQRDLQHTAAVENEKVADTQAEGAHKVALARCESLSGNAQKSCRDQADADYEAAKADAKQERAKTDPKP